VLEELRIRGLGVIEDAVLPLGPGLTAVTGETGAGKTMVVTGLLLLFGGRGEASRVRTGQDQAVIDGRVVVAADSVAAQRAVDAGGALDDDQVLTLRRTVSAAGRSRAFAGGAPVPVSVLGDLGEQLFSVHGQSDQIRLSRPAEQRAALDRFAGTDVAGYAAAFHAWRGAEEQLADRTRRARELAREADLLRAGMAEIAAADPKPGEDAELRAVASRLGHADALRQAARTAHDALLGDADDPAGYASDVATLLGIARHALDLEAPDDPELATIRDGLVELAALTADLSADLVRYEALLDADPDRLAQVEERRALLTALTRKYGPELDDVRRWAEQAERQLADLDVSEEALATLTARRDERAAQTARLGRALTDARRQAAGRLADQVSAELAGLAMPDAELTVFVEPRTAGAGSHPLPVGAGDVLGGPDGLDDVGMLLRPRRDAPALPLHRGASGGELARVMLAIEVSLGDSGRVIPTLVFDEVDAGVGGRAAIEVGRRLARLARDHQVIVVTHLAQVAAYADRHVVIDQPDVAADHGVSEVRLVEGAERVTELARMLAGSGTETARDHAAELRSAAAEEVAEGRLVGASPSGPAGVRPPG
jgi:DNA repair protein RecN (Recombination protein N)